MTVFTLLKFVHVLSVITAVGANLTYAYWMRRAGHERDRLVYTIQAIRRLDRSIANPAYGVAFVTGVAMVLTGAYSFQTRWIGLAIVIYFAVALLGVVFFGPAIRRQLDEAERDPASGAYTAAERRSNRLGILTLVAVLVIVFLMVTKPI